MFEKIQPILVHPLYGTIIFIVSLFAIAMIVNLFVRRILIKVVESVINLTPYGRDHDLIKHPIVPRLLKIIPAIIVAHGANLAPHISPKVTAIVENVANATIVLFLTMALSAAIGLMDTIYHRRPDGRLKPIRTYLQAAKIAIYVIAVILMAATLFDRSPTIMLSGLGAMAAVLMLVFQDTILSIVAGVQISSNDMVRIGDWIEMKSLHANGEVVDIALHTVRVQNWDKTITAIPIRKLVTDAFINWRGMRESGGRRIMRAINLDQNSVRFLSEGEITKYHDIRLLVDYLDKKVFEIDEWNSNLGAFAKDVRNTRRLTNIGLFRAYMTAYLAHHKQIRPDMMRMVRQLAPGSLGVPIEIYAFTDTVQWAEYEAIQADIFDHILSILPIFDLRVFQEVGGFDLSALKTESRAG